MSEDGTVGHLKNGGSEVANDGDWSEPGAATQDGSLGKGTDFVNLDLGDANGPSTAGDLLNVSTVMDELGAANGASNSGNIGFADMSDNDDAEVAFLVHGAGGSVAVYYAKNADAKSTIEEDDFEPLGVMSEGNAPQAFDLA